MSSEKQLLTIGYSGHSLQSFVASLKEQQVTALLDIRFTPLSRKKGFSKTALKETLENVGIKYFHIKALGSPKELRVQLSQSKDYTAFFRDFRNHLIHQPEGIEKAASLADLHHLCLMCVETQPHECHRSIVAETIASCMKSNLTIEHLQN